MASYTLINFFLRGKDPFEEKYQFSINKPNIYENIKE